MKKIAVILLLLVYAGATTGATIHLHYCMNQFVGSSLWHSGENSKCGKCGMKAKNNGCCKDEHKQAKLSTEHQKASVSQEFQLFNAAGILPYTNAFHCFTIQHSLITPPAHKPPIFANERLYLHYRVFLI